MGAPESALEAGVGVGEAESVAGADIEGKEWWKDDAERNEELGGMERISVPGGKGGGNERASGG
jgi:hypothetical protein